MADLRTGGLYGWERPTFVSFLSGHCHLTVATSEKTGMREQMVSLRPLALQELTELQPTTHVSKSSSKATRETA